MDIKKFADIIDLITDLGDDVFDWPCNFGCGARGSQLNKLDIMKVYKTVVVVLVGKKYEGRDFLMSMLNIQKIVKERIKQGYNKVKIFKNIFEFIA